MDARPIERRTFANWWMGVALVRRDEQPGGKRFDLRTMSGEDALTLASELAKSGLQRRLAAA